MLKREIAVEKKEKTPLLGLSTNAHDGGGRRGRVGVGVGFLDAVPVSSQSQAVRDVMVYKRRGTLIGCRSKLWQPPASRFISLVASPLSIHQPHFLGQPSNT